MTVGAVVGKELRELRRMELMRPVVVIAALFMLSGVGVMSWSSYLMDRALWGWVLVPFLAAAPGLFAAYFAAESIVGERERHTLETLLASPLGEYQMLLGKALAHFLVMGGLSVLLFLLVWGSAWAGSGAALPAPPALALLVLVVLFLHLFVLSETIGFFVGQRARTVATANSVVAPLFALPFAVFAFLPALTVPYVESATAVDFAGFSLRVAAVVVALVLAALALLLPPVLRRARAERLLA